MSFGLRMVNAAGAVQVDADYRNYRAFANGTAPAGTAVPSVSGVYKSLIDFPARPVAPMVLAQPGSTYVATPGFDINIAHLDLFTSASVSIPYDMVDETGGIIDADSYGMQVSNADAERCFDSREKYLIVEDVVQFNPHSIPVQSISQRIGNPLTISHANIPNAKYGILFFSGTYVRRVGTGGPGTGMMILAISFAAIRQYTNSQAQLAMMDCELFQIPENPFSDVDARVSTGYVFVARVSN